MAPSTELHPSTAELLKGGQVPFSFNCCLIVVHPISREDNLMTSAQTSVTSACLGGPPGPPGPLPAPSVLGQAEPSPVAQRMKDIILPLQTPGLRQGCRFRFPTKSRGCFKETENSFAFLSPDHSFCYIPDNLELYYSGFFTLYL